MMNYVSVFLFYRADELRVASHNRIQLPESARPFMGPNMYLTPPGSFTSFHQDGFGTVDSGHTCISGTLEHHFSMSFNFF